MGHWQDRIVYYRDFAYDTRRLRMASGNIGDVPAATFAEYVPAFSKLCEPQVDGACQPASAGGSPSDFEWDAPSLDAVEVPEFALACSGYPGVRPPLAHRLYSHRLHVRAQAKLQRDRLLSGPLVDVYVGKRKRHWALHRNLLCHHSELLESELQGEGKKKLDKLELPDQDPSGFELLVKWLYQGRLDDVSDMADPNQKYDYAVSCHKLYLLCDRFDMPQLKNVAMDQYRKGLNEAQLVPDADEINDIYRKSPVGSPFRRLMTKIAARQIMDPNSDRNVETYRECFEHDPEFAIDLVNAIKTGTGGTLFDDPTDPGNECEYHDHEAGSNCHIKGKGKIKQVLKAPARLHDPKSSKSVPSANPDHRLHHPLPPPSHPPLPRQARRQDGGKSVGPLRRRLTSPASSTVETSTENATATPLSPKEQKDKFRKVTPPQARLPGPALVEEESLPAQDGPHQSSDEGSHQLPTRQDASLQSLDSSVSDISDKNEAAKSTPDDVSPRRGLWEWARAGTGRLGMIGRLPHPGIMTSKAATTAVNGALDGGSLVESLGSLDDFSIPSTVSTKPEDEEHQVEVAAAKAEGLGIANSTADVSTMDLTSFSQTKRSSDDLAAASTNGTPSPKAVRIDSARGGDESDASAPATPSPAPRNREDQAKENGDKDDMDVTPSPHRIPKYKIALASHILSPSRALTS